MNKRNTRSSSTGRSSSRGSAPRKPSGTKLNTGEPRAPRKSTPRIGGPGKPSSTKLNTREPREPRMTGPRSSALSKPSSTKFSTREPRTPREAGSPSDKNKNWKAPRVNDRAERSRPSFDKKDDRPYYKPKPYATNKTTRPGKTAPKVDDGSIRLNKYLSNAGIASRREADTFITAGLVTVNGKIITELGTKVQPTDDIRYNGSSIKRDKPRYILLNKPKDYICTVDDPQSRKTVLELTRTVCRERIYPVGRLDRNTTGLLLLTNDGEMADKLMHPRGNVMKVYQVELDKNIKKEDFEKIAEGIALEDGFFKPDELAFDAGAGNKRTLGITIHSGKNRIVRRLFEHFDYEVVKLDRVYYAGLTKKDLPRGKARNLTTEEINMLKMVSKPQKNSAVD